ncbi:MAG TPA: futalosine hydrolase [Longimicrobiaceae bacterium]|nr:futalosine hydrolase [Longimicrobiaceae bacterium]
MPKPIVVVCSMELEARPLLERVESPIRRSWTGPPAWDGRVGGREVMVLTAGMGKTNAAHSLTVVLEREPAAGVVGFGVGGGYPGSSLKVGDLAIATEEHYGDEGVATPTGWISCEEIGIPLHARGGDVLYNRFPVDHAALPALAGAVRRQGVQAIDGPFVTVSCCSGTAARAKELAERFDAICESMEGAAYAHVAAMYAVPFVELRGISNLVEDRDLSRWRLADAAERAAAAVAAIVPIWNPDPRPTERAVS